MEQRNTITINKRDLWRMLAREGVAVPEDGYWSFDEGGEAIEIHWSQPIYSKVTHPEEAFAMFPSNLQGMCQEIRDYMNRDNRIGAIKAMRAGTGWTLKTAKDWVDNNYPRRY